MKPIILCVDDEKIILDSIKGTLREAFGSACQYETAQSGPDALEVLEEIFEEEEEGVILIVSDWLMPEMKGDEFLIKVHQKHPKIIKVMLTGQADSEAVARAFAQADLFKCLTKPWSDEELIMTVQEALKKL